MRCKCCNSETTLLAVNKHTGEYEDMCSVCISASMTDWDYLEDHQCILENAKEGVSDPIIMDYF